MFAMPAALDACLLNHGVDCKFSVAPVGKVHDTDVLEEFHNSIDHRGLKSFLWDRASQEMLYG